MHHGPDRLELIFKGRAEAEAIIAAGRLACDVELTDDLREQLDESFRAKLEHYHDLAEQDRIDEARRNNVPEDEFDIHYYGGATGYELGPGSPHGVKKAAAQANAACEVVIEPEELDTALDYLKTLAGLPRFEAWRQLMRAEQKLAKRMLKDYDIEPKFQRLLQSANLKK
jgi:hypothetical protein